MNVTIKDGLMTIVLPVNETPVVSASGKTRIVATSHGNMPTTCVVDGQAVRVGVNAYIANVPTKRSKAAKA